MDRETGKLSLVRDEADAYARGLVPVCRSLTAKEKTERQIRMYSPCGCGSGKKFKFCCHTANTPAEARCKASPQPGCSTAERRTP